MAGVKKAAGGRADKKEKRLLAPEGTTTSHLQESQSYRSHQLKGAFNGSGVPTQPEVALEDAHKPQHGAQRERGRRLKRREISGETQLQK